MNPLFYFVCIACQHPIPINQTDCHLIYIRKSKRLNGSVSISSFERAIIVRKMMITIVLIMIMMIMKMVMIITMVMMIIIIIVGIIMIMILILTRNDNDNDNYNKKKMREENHVNSNFHNEWR